MENLALIIFAYGEGFALLHDCDQTTNQFISDCGGSSEGFSLSQVGVDFHAPQGFHICVGYLRLVDSHSKDHLHALKLFDLRPVTPNEWSSYCAGEWPWEHDGQNLQ